MDSTLPVTIHAFKIDDDKIALDFLWELDDNMKGALGCFVYDPEIKVVNTSEENGDGDSDSEDGSVNDSSASLLKSAIMICAAVALAVVF